jgi:hypothetical protein
VSGLLHALAALPPYPLDRRPDEPQSWSGRLGGEKIFYPTRNRTPTPRSSSTQPILTMLSLLLDMSYVCVEINAVSMSRFLLSNIYCMYRIYKKAYSNEYETLDSCKALSVSMYACKYVNMILSSSWTFWLVSMFGVSRSCSSLVDVRWIWAFWLQK